MEMSSAICRCGALPLPEDEYSTCPGRDFASAMNSFTDFTGKDGCTVSTPVRRNRTPLQSTRAPLIFTTLAYLS